MKTALALAAAILSLGPLGGCTAGPQDTATPSTTRPAPPAPVEPEVDLDAIVDDPAARIVGVTVSDDRPRVRSVLWSRCRTPRCHRADRVLAVTDDGFATRHLLALSPQTAVTDLHGRYLLTTRRGGHVVQPDGTLTEVRWGAGPSGPVQGGEVAVDVHRFGRVHAVDPLTGAGHLVPTPGGTRGLLSDGPGRLSVFVDGGKRMLTTYDGGRTWDEQAAFGVPAGDLAQVIGSADSAPAVVTGGDGATLLPVGALHRWDGDAWQRFARPDEPMAYLGAGGAVLPDGRLLLAVESWSSGSRPTGLWVGSARDWADLRPVRTGTPFDAPDPSRETSSVLDVVVAPSEVTVYAVHDSPSGQTLWSSTDAGRSWAAVATR